MSLTMIKILLAVGFGGPMLILSSYFVYAARRMMREETEKARMRQGSAQAMRYDKRRRHARYIAASARTGACR